jgi:enoyl-CoA hydratase/carnithine racemase
MPSLTRDGDVFVLDLGADENRLNPDWVGSVDALLDEVEAADTPRALVLGATGKIWSNGFDLDWILANPTDMPALLAQTHALYARVLTLGVPTVGALTGHTFAAGAMLALALDSRVMRSDRGYFCLPEADINIPFTTGMSALIQSQLPQPIAHEAMVTARRYTAEEALAVRIVDEIAVEAEVLPRAIARANTQTAKDPTTLATIKQRAYRPVVEALLSSEGNTFDLPG